MNRLARHKYLLLLLAMVLLLVVHPLLTGTLGEWLLLDVLTTFVFLAAFPIVFAGRSRRLLAVLTGAPTLVGLWTGYAVPELPRAPVALGFHLSAVLFLGLAVASVLWDISREGPVSRDSVLGGFCGYLLVGLMFGHLYCFLEIAAPGSFVGRGLVPQQLPAGGRLHYLLNYFSLITLTTVGFGDVAPASDAARGLSAVEAIAGQFYIAVLIAELIGKRLSGATSGGPADAPNVADRDRVA
jgi:hypothetical protein